MSALKSANHVASLSRTWLSSRLPNKSAKIYRLLYIRIENEFMLFTYKKLKRYIRSGGIETAPYGHVIPRCRQPPLYAWTQYSCSLGIEFSQMILSWIWQKGAPAADHTRFFRGNSSGCLRTFHREAGLRNSLWYYYLTLICPSIAMHGTDFLATWWCYKTIRERCRYQTSWSYEKEFTSGCVGPFVPFSKLNLLIIRQVFI